MKILWTVGIKNLAWYRLIILLVGLYLCFSVLEAKSLGKQQTVFGIDEMDLLLVIKQRAQDFINSGKWDDTQSQMQEKAKSYVKKPPVVAGINLSTSSPRSFYHTVAMKMPVDIKNAFGNVVVGKGTDGNLRIPA